MICIIHYLHYYVIQTELFTNCQFSNRVANAFGIVAAASR